MSAKTILIVEDEPEVTSLLEMRLQPLGYRILSAANGEEGLEKARKLVPDLIILDIMLPKIDGFKVCRLLKFDKKYRHIPIIIFTARVQESDISTGHEVGADAYICKPFKSGELIDKIRKLIGEAV